MVHHHHNVQCYERLDSHSQSHSHSASSVGHQSDEEVQLHDTIECDECMEEESMIAALANENLMLHDRVNELERELGVYESRIAQQSVLINQLQSLIWSMENNDVSCVRQEPCEEDASILNAVENGETTLMIALLSSSPAGQSSRMILERIGSNALQIACQKGHRDIVEWLLKTGDVDVHADFDSALQWAARRGDHDLAYVLLMNGADPTSLNGCALRIALDRGHNDVARLLMEHVSYSSNKNDLDGMKLV